MLFTLWFAFGGLVPLSCMVGAPLVKGPLVTLVPGVVTVASALVVRTPVVLAGIHGFGIGMMAGSLGLP